MPEATTTTGAAGTTTVPPPVVDAAADKTSSATTTATEGQGTQTGAATTTTTTATSGEGTKVEAKAGDTAVADIEVTLPKGVEADPELLGGFKAWAKEQGLKSEGAQKALDLFVKNQQAEVTKAQASWAKQQTEWESSLKADKEFGGAKYDENVEMARQALARFGSSGLVEYLGKSGLGSHPELVRAFHRIGKAFADDSVGGTTSGAAVGTSKDSSALDLYPSMKPKE